jgi:hypothetical protein
VCKLPLLRAGLGLVARNPRGCNRNFRKADGAFALLRLPCLLCCRPAYLILK